MSGIEAQLSHRAESPPHNWIPWITEIGRLTWMPKDMRLSILGGEKETLWPTNMLCVCVKDRPVMQWVVDSS